jgi:hypothetical protein
MNAVLFVLVLIPLLALIINKVFDRLEQTHKRILITIAFVLIGVGAYSWSFAVDLLIQVIFGDLTFDNFLWPLITWSSLGWCCLAICLKRPVSAWARVLPFWLFGLEAVIGAFVHPRNLITAVVMVIGSLGYVRLSRRKWPAPIPPKPWSRPINQSPAPANQRPAPINQTRSSVNAKIRRGFAPPIGEYRLGMKLPGDGLSELDLMDTYELTGSFGDDDQRIFHAPRAAFGGALFNIVIGATGGWVRKVSALYASETRRNRDDIWENSLDEIESYLGAPASEAENICDWDTEDGNAVLIRLDNGYEYFVTITLTSRYLRPFDAGRHLDLFYEMGRSDSV